MTPAASASRIQAHRSEAGAAGIHHPSLDPGVMGARRTRAVRSVVCLLLGLAGGCSQGPQPAPEIFVPHMIGQAPKLNSMAEPPDTPDAVTFRRSGSGPDDTLGAIRRKALRTAATAYGSQHGYRRRAWEINDLLAAHAAQATRLFDFNRVIARLPDHKGIVIPPVIVRTHDNQQLATDAGQLALSDVNLTLARPGELAIAVPTALDYLIMPIEEPVTPQPGLLPRTEAEAEHYSQWFNDGWYAGRQLARDEFATRLQHLLDDYQGMLEYRRLVAEGSMTRMYLSQASFGTTILGKTMRIGDRVLQVERMPEFQARAEDDWAG